MDARERAMRRAAELGIEFVNRLPDRHVGAQTDAASLAAQLGGPLPDDGEDPEAVVEEMARVLDPGLVASAGPSSQVSDAGDERGQYTRNAIAGHGLKI
jgi:hypothetical protein